MDYEKHIDELLKKQDLIILNNMLNDCNDENYKNNINQIILYFNHTDNNKYVKENVTINKNLNEVDNYIYKRFWNKLPYENKLIKINEYLNNSLFKTSEKNLTIIKTKILNDFKNKKLNSSKKVNYDISSCKIIIYFI